MISAVAAVAVPRPLLFGLLAVGAVVAVAAPQPTSSFAAGFAAGVGSTLVVSFMKGPGRPEPSGSSGEDAP